MKNPAVYVLTNRPYGTLYIGVTSHLQGRVWLHQQHVCSGFSKKYNLDRLVYYELCADMSTAIAREKQLKNWQRAWKIDLIENMNPAWRDLWPDILD